MIIACDFDGVLCDPTHVRPGFRMGEPMEGAIEAMHRLHAQGDTVIIFTARDRFEPVEDWLQHFRIPYDRVTNIKFPCDVYLDDKAIRFTSWAQVIEYL